jgi:glycine/D-amino acid oxidase-like deaminating enzyme
VTSSKTVAVIGRGSVGLAAAATHLLERGLMLGVLEAGARAGHAARQWWHVQLFASDHEAAARVELGLSETGMCTRGGMEAGIVLPGCCGGPAPAGVKARCAKDANAKAVGKSGCGCL